MALDRFQIRIVIAMGNELSLVQSTGSGCLIYRETSGAYVVRHEQAPRQRQLAATLAGAYAACRGWEQRVGDVTG